MTNCDEDLLREHRALMREYGRAQTRCSEQLYAQVAEIDRLQAQTMCLRAAVIVRDTVLAWAYEDRAALERSSPGLPKRLTLARWVGALLARVRDLMRKRLHWKRADRRLPPTAASAPAAEAGEHLDDPEALESSLVAADLVICQTGCLSHGAYWRVKDHCKRTGKTCVLVAQPDALRILSFHAASDGDGRTRIAELQVPRHNGDGSSRLL